ncbi:hypothetical protein ACHAQA_004480 [Verticillium albo-atrum]
MRDLAKLLSSHYDKFPDDFQDELKELVEDGKHYTLFTLLEDLIEARKIDGLLSRHDKIRHALFEVFGERYPWLAEADLGETAWQREQERSLAAFKERAALDAAAGISYDTSQYGYELGLARAHVEKFGIKLPAQATRVPKVPLAPSRGGLAPRQPFTTGWTFRAGPPGAKASFDPKTTCEQFFPQEPVTSDTEEEEDDEYGSKDVEMQDVGQKTGKRTYDPQQVIQGIINRLAVSETVTFTKTSTASMASTLIGIIKVGDNVFGMTPDISTWSALQLKDFFDEALQEQGLEAQPISLDEIQKLIDENEVVQSPDGEEDEDEDVEMQDTEGNIAQTTQTPAIAVVPATPVVGSNQGTTGEEQETAGFLQPTQATSQPENTTSARPAISVPEASNSYDENWLRNWLIRNNAATPDDLKMSSYRGWRIHSPKIMLIRIKNFLADEDLDRTLHWKDQYAEILIYLHHLRANVYTDQDWGYDLHEAICMAMTHNVYERHHYGEPELILDFPPVEHPKRLQAPLGVPKIVVDDKGQQHEPVKPRYLQHRMPESVHDIDYQIPGRLLRTRFLTWYHEDLTRLWYLENPFNPVPGGVGSGNRGKSFMQHGYDPDFNSAEVADDRYVKCMTLGAAETARTLGAESNFHLSDKDFIASIQTEGLVPDGHAVRRFAEFRGAKRAALQQCIEHFGTVDDGTAASAAPDGTASHFRRLVLPTPWREKERIRAEAQKVIVFPPLALEKPPERTKIDPFGFVYWHDQMLRNHEERAYQGGIRAEQGNAKYYDAAKVAILPSRNFMGPFRPTLVPRKIDLEWAQVRRFRNMITNVKLAKRRAPRPLLDEILDHFHRATREEQPDDDVVIELQRQAEGLEDGEMFRPISSRDHHWMAFIVGPSMNKILLEEMQNEPEGLDYKMFTERLQVLLDDPWEGAFLANAGDYKTVAEIRDAVNALGAANPLKEPPFTDDRVFTYCQDLSKAGRLAIGDGPDGTFVFARPDLPHHPELRIRFSVPSLHTANPPIIIPDRSETELPAPSSPLLDWRGALVANLPFLVDLLDGSGPPRATRVSLAYRTLAYRLGHWTKVYERSVEAAYQALEAEGAAVGFSLSADRYRVQIDDMHDVWRQEVESNRHESGAQVSYGSVVRAADPGGVWRQPKAAFGLDDSDSDSDSDAEGEEAWTKWTYHPKAIEAVRVGLIRELSDGANMLWPVRPRWEGDQGKETMTLAREKIWDFGRTGARGRADAPRKQFFSINKWLLHLQSEATQEKIRASGPNPAAPREPKPAAAGQDTEQTIKTSVTETPATKTVTTITKPPATKGKAAPPVTKPPAAKGKQPTDLGPRLHETLEPAYQFIPGVTEYREGDTPRQKAAVKRAVVDEIRDALGDETTEAAPRRRWFWGWSGRFEPPPAADPTPDPEAPLFEFPKLQPHQIPASGPRPPIGQKKKKDRGPPHNPPRF